MTIFLQITLFGLVWGALYALMANGLNLVYGVMKILNIGHGELLMLGAYTTFWLFTLWGVNPILSLVASAGLLFLLGLAIQQSVVRPIIRISAGSIEFLERGTLIAFFGVLLFLQNGALLLWTADYRVISYLTRPISAGGLFIAPVRLIVLGVGLLLCVLTHLFLTRTRLGKSVRAISQDREVALLMAVDANRVGLIAFGIGSALAGIVGSLVSLIYVVTPTMGLIFTIKAFTVMVVGGLGNALGTLRAGLALGLAESYGAYLFGESYKDVIDYAVLIGMVLLISYGWVRRPEME
ncbi:MAG: branched-chain amino acid ABC transporter permease [Candidatus Tectomicrobia bacterium]|nr:branched-chain amino acid ABC transporter permease [Candidatus Tectomicrobia bacterium]